MLKVVSFNITNWSDVMHIIVILNSCKGQLITPKQVFSYFNISCSLRPVQPNQA